MSIAFFLFMVVLAVLLCFYMRGGNADSWFAVDRAQCRNFVLIYYLSIVIFGWYIFNMLRNWTIAKYAASEAV